jgi:hypothetical protein
MFSSAAASATATRVTARARSSGSPLTPAPAVSPATQPHGSSPPASAQPPRLCRRTRHTSQWTEHPHLYSRGSPLYPIPQPRRSAVSDRCGEGGSYFSSWPLPTTAPSSAWPVRVRPGGDRHWPVSLTGRHRDIGGDDVGGVPVQTAAGAVVSHGGPGISVRGRFLHVPQRDPRVQRGGDERVPQRVRPGRLGDPGTAADPADNPPGTVPV